MLIFQLILIILIAALDFGPLGRAGSIGFGVGLGVIATWAFTWFGASKNALRFALLLGLLFDVVSFTFFGVWLAVFAGVHLITDLLKTRFFEVSSITLALTTLAAASLWAALIVGIAAHTLDLFSIGIGIATNVVIGFVLYYFLAIRFKFLARWTGRRL